MLVFVAFAGSIVLIVAGGIAFVAGGSLRPAGAALAGLGVVLLLLALSSAANFNA